MDLDHAKIDDAVLALVHLGLHDDLRTWKGFEACHAEARSAKADLNSKATATRR